MRWARLPAGRAQRLAQRVLDLGVDATQVIGRPPSEGLVNARVKAQQQALAFRHRPRPAQAYSEPVLTTGCTARSPHSTTSRFATICALRSASRSTTWSAPS